MGYILEITDNDGGVPEGCFLVFLISTFMTTEVYLSSINCQMYRYTDGPESDLHAK